jgi:putative hydrolase of HD superfamily
MTGDMQTKAPPPILQLRGRETPPLVEAYFEINHLKQLYRQGWLRRGIPRERCESVAEHSFAVALLALLLADVQAPGLDLSKALRMALLHDLGEIYAGDLTPADAVSAGEKHRLEEQAVVQVLAKLPGGAAHVALWQEYERGASPEARYIRQVDRLEMALQASVYESQGLADLAEFFASAGHDLFLPRLRGILAALEALRPWPSEQDTASP